MIVLAVVSGALLLVTWVVYPLAVRWIASCLPVRPVAEPEPWPSVSVIVASRDTPAAVAARVADLLAGDYPPDRLSVVIGVDSAHLASVAEYGLADPRVTVVQRDPPGGKAAALNAAVRAAAGEVLVFTDTHQRFAPDAIRVLVQEVTGGPFGIVSGQLELPEGKQRSLLDWYWRLERRLRRDEARIFSAVGVSGSIYAMRRGLWTPLPAGLILDDLYVPMRAILAGHRVGFTAAAKAHDARRTEPGQEFRRKVRTLTGNFQLCAWLPPVLVPWRNRAWAPFVLHKIARLLTPWLGVAFAGSITWMLLRWSSWREIAAAIVAIVLGLALVWAMGLGRRLAAYAWWLIVMQAAIVVATYYGLIGNWHVWGALESADG